MQIKFYKNRETRKGETAEILDNIMLHMKKMMSLQKKCFLFVLFSVYFKYLLVPIGGLIETDIQYMVLSYIPWETNLFLYTKIRLIS